MALPIAAMTSAEILTVRDGQIVRAISRADVAWHILALAEDPAPGHQRTPVITTGANRKSRPAETRNLPARHTPTVR